MNGIDKITARISSDAQAEIAELTAQAKEKAAALEQDYQEKAAAQAAAASAAGKQAAQAQLERLTGAAEMEAKKLLLSAKQGCLDEAFRAAEEKLTSMPDDMYADLLARITVKFCTTGREELIFNARDRARSGEKTVAKANALLAQKMAPPLANSLKKKGTRAGEVLSAVVAAGNAAAHGTALLTLSEETREIAGGVILKNGNVEINCAFETQLRLLRESMASEVAAILFPAKQAAKNQRAK